MSSFEIVFPFGANNLSESEVLTKQLIRGLPDYYARSLDSNNYAALDAIAERFQAEERDIFEVNQSTNINTAKTITELEKSGELVGVYPRRNEDLETYRARIKAEFVLVTGEGTPKDVIENAANLLEVSKETIDYTNAPNGAGGEIQLEVPVRAFDNATLARADLGDLLSRTAAAGYNVSVVVKGSFTYITPDTYSANGHDPDIGYDGLDTNGEPKDSGGTYAGVLR